MVPVQKRSTHIPHKVGLSFGALAFVASFGGIWNFFIDTVARSSHGLSLLVGMVLAIATASVFSYGLSRFLWKKWIPQDTPTSTWRGFGIGNVVALTAYFPMFFVLSFFMTGSGNVLASPAWAILGIVFTGWFVGPISGLFGVWTQRRFAVRSAHPRKIGGAQTIEHKHAHGVDEPREQNEEDEDPSDEDPLDDAYDPLLEEFAKLEEQLQREDNQTSAHAAAHHGAYISK